MIEKLNNIYSVDLKLYGEPLTTKIPSQKNIEAHKEVPFKFDYNGSWRIEHKCGMCNDKVSFGFHYESLNRFPKYSYQQTHYWCSKYYSNEFLNAVSNLFANSNLVSIEEIDAIIYKGHLDENYPITSSLKPIFYCCENCNSNFISIMFNASPLAPERGNISGSMGLIEIKEVLEIRSTQTNSLKELLDNHKI